MIGYNITIIQLEFIIMDRRRVLIVVQVIQHVIKKIRKFKTLYSIITIREYCSDHKHNITIVRATSLQICVRWVQTSGAIDKYPLTLRSKT